MKQLDAINMRIASKQTIDSLKEQGFIYEDEHGEPHVTEQKIALLPPTKVKAMLNKLNTLGYFYPYFNRMEGKVK